ncbi:PAAR domain-containing protein [Pseudomonas putida]
MRGIIRIHDKLCSGGEVRSAGDGMLFGGREVARQGDTVFCPIPGHGVNSIAEGDTSFTQKGRPIALHGHRCECGSSLIRSLPLAGRR